MRPLLVSLLAAAASSAILSPRACARDDGGPFDQIRLVTRGEHVLVWNIDKPDIRRRLTEYPQIRFEPGDVVIIQAGGCVQTGGHGKTWKRYVDPQGPDSERLYHGLIWIPGVTEGVVRVKGVIGKRFWVPSGGDPNQRYLRLGFEDDDYGDNGYWGREGDDGNYDQCARLGNAFVRVIIERGLPHPYASPPAPLDLVSSTRDQNFILMNPRWGFEIAHPGQLPDAMRLANGFFERGSLAAAKPSLRRPRAWTTQSPSVDSASGINDFISSFHSSPLHGHINWFAATYEGTISWQEHSADDDYNMTLVTRNNVGLTVQNQGGLLLEFDSDETIDHFVNGWWARFHQAVDRGDSEASSMVNGRRAIATGFMGLDVQHDAHAELHPVWALAIRTEQTALEDRWVMFVRNWGNEGFCSQDQHYLDLLKSEYTFKLPWRRGAENATTGPDSIFWTSPGNLENPEIRISLVDGILATFKLDVPERRSFVYGELTIHWSGRSVQPPYETRNLEETVQRGRNARKRDATEGTIRELLKTMPENVRGQLSAGLFGENRDQPQRPTERKQVTTIHPSINPEAFSLVVAVGERKARTDLRLNLATPVVRSVVDQQRVNGQKAAFETMKQLLLKKQPEEYKKAFDK